MVSWLLGRQALDVAADTATAAGRAVRPAWEPSLASFRGRKRQNRCDQTSR